MTRSTHFQPKTLTMKEMSPNEGDRISGYDAMKLNRAARRKLGKANGAKIYGTNTAHLKQKPHALTTFTGKKV